MAAHTCDPSTQQAAEENWRFKHKISLDYVVPGQMYGWMYMCVYVYTYDVCVCKKSRQQLEISILPNPSMNYKNSHEIRTLIFRKKNKQVKVTFVLTLKYHDQQWVTWSLDGLLKGKAGGGGEWTSVMCAFTVLALEPLNCHLYSWRVVFTVSLNLVFSKQKDLAISRLVYGVKQQTR